MEQKRIDYLDIAKGIGIILVVLHHTSGSGSFPNIYIGSFHMPLFFIISGMCFNELRYPNFSEYLKRKCRVLMWQMIVFSVLMLVLSWLAGSSFYTIEKFMDGHLPLAYWFVWILFLVELAYYVVCRLCKSKFSRICIVGIIFSMGLIRQLYLDVEIPFNLSSFLYSFCFYAVGNIFYSDIRKALNYKYLPGGVFLPLISVFYLHEGVGLSGGYLASPWLSAPIAILASLGLLSICSNFPQRPTKARRILIWFGHNTFVILMVHMFAINLSCMYIRPLISSHAVYKIIEQLFVWVLSLSFVWFVNNHAKWMLGKK